MIKVVEPQKNLTQRLIFLFQYYRFVVFLFFLPERNRRFEVNLSEEFKN